MMPPDEHSGLICAAGAMRLLATSTIATCYCVRCVPAGIRMRSERQTHHASPGDTSLQLDCEFDMPNFSLFDNPIVWRKRQLDDEPMPINFQGNILPPFFDAKRFTTQLTTPARGRYNPVLTILGEWSALYAQQ